jgi:hypothetical protein
VTLQKKDTEDREVGEGWDEAERWRDVVAK